MARLWARAAWRAILPLIANPSAFHRLFESLQEGVYFTTPGGMFLEANPALVRMLGFEKKEDLLAVPRRRSTKTAISASGCSTSSIATAL